ncbi:MAG: DinB family protein [Thermoanaerobaculia bacterium]
MSHRENANPIPYADLVGAKDPLGVLEDTPKRIEELVRGWDRTRWSKSYAKGKWSGAQVVLHLVHDEVAWSHRVRMALTVPGYVPQPFDGGKWVALESPPDPELVLQAFLALRRLNLMLYRRLTAKQRSRTIAHPEFGAISVDWILRILAGHDLHHLQHLRAIAAA